MAQISSATCSVVASTISAESAIGDTEVGGAYYEGARQYPRARPISAGRDLEVVEGVRGHSKRAVCQTNSWQLFLVHRLDNDPGRNPKPACRFCRQQDLGIGHSTPPSSKPSLPWMIRITVASSS